MGTDSIMKTVELTRQALDTLNRLHTQTDAETHTDLLADIIESGLRDFAPIHKMPPGAEKTAAVIRIPTDTLERLEQAAALSEAYHGEKLGVWDLVEAFIWMYETRATESLYDALVERARKVGDVRRAVGEILADYQPLSTFPLLYVWGKGMSSAYTYAYAYALAYDVEQARLLICRDSGEVINQLWEQDPVVHVAPVGYHLEA